MSGRSEGISLDAVAAMERNLVFVFGEFARSLPSGEFYESPELCWTLTSIEFPIFNSLLATRLDSSEADAAIEAAKERAQTKGVGILWWVLPGNAPRDLAERLRRAGFVHSGTMPGMALDLAHAQALGEPTQRDGVAITQVAGDLAAREWCDVLCEAFDFPAPFAQGYLPCAVAVAAKPEGALRNYALTRNGEMVGTASLAVHEGVAGIYNVATGKQARHKGFGAMLTAHALREGRELGARLAVLQASKAGRGVYEALGFRDVCAVVHFTWSHGGRP